MHARRCGDKNDDGWGTSKSMKTRVLRGFCEHCNSQFKILRWEIAPIANDRLNRAC